MYKFCNKRLLKYLILTVIVGLCAKWVASHKMDTSEVCTVGLTAGLAFILLDLYTPTINKEDM